MQRQHRSDVSNLFRVHPEITKYTRGYLVRSFANFTLMRYSRGTEPLIKEYKKNIAPQNLQHVKTDVFCKIAVALTRIWHSY